MAVTAVWYGNGLLNIAKNNVDWEADDIYVALLDSGYTPDQDAHDFFNDVEGDEITGTGYTAGGVAVTTSAPTYDSGTNEVRFDSTDPQWTSASFTARYAVFYKVRGGASSADEVLFYINFGGDETVSSGTFTIQGDATGFAKITAA